MSFLLILNLNGSLICS